MEGVWVPLVLLFLFFLYVSLEKSAAPVTAAASAGAVQGTMRSLGAGARLLMAL